MNPGGVSHTFLPPNKVYERDQLADGSKFCQQWTRDPTVYPYPLLPLQNTVAQVGSSRRILLNTSARVMHYNYDGVGNDNLNVDSIDVLAAPPNRFTGDLFLNVDMVNAHQVSLAVHIPMDRNLDTVTWVPQWELSVLARESTKEDTATSTNLQVSFETPESRLEEYKNICLLYTSPSPRD